MRKPMLLCRRAIERAADARDALNAALQREEAARHAAGRELRDHRRIVGLGLREAARRVQCSPAMLRDIERGRRWSWPIVRMLADLYEQAGVGTERLSDLKNQHRDAARVYWPEGAMFTCQICGEFRNATSAEYGRYLARGGPKCCGATMELVSAPR